MTDPIRTDAPILSTGPVDAQGPVNVVVQEERLPNAKWVQRQATDPSLPAQTTFQQDLTAAGQRKVNLIWENTQAVIAVMVVLGNMVVGVYHGLVPIADGAHRDFPTILSSSLFLIVGFYFSRTNHSAIGGVGQKPRMVEYAGR